jgi:hypothetical protein
MKIQNTLILGFSALLVLSACSGTKETLGLTREAPDEFAIVKRAPLELPPDYSLRPPAPGTPRPQEKATDQQARQSVFGFEQEKQYDNSGGDTILLQKAGANAPDPNIRQRIDAESTQYATQNQSAVKKLLNIGSDDPATSATVVDAEAEAERLIKNQEEGKPVTEGETPSIEE